MILPKLDYSPLFNAVQSIGQARQAGVGVQQLGLQQKSLQISQFTAGVSAVTSLVEAGMQVYKMAETRDLEQSKADIFQTQGLIHAKRVELIQNNKYKVDTAPDGSQMIAIDPEFDLFVDEQIRQAQEKHTNFGQTQSFIESSLQQYAVNQKGYALEQFAAQEATATAELGAMNGVQAVDDSVRAGNAKAINAHISAATYLSPAQKKLEKERLYQLYEEGIRKRDILNVLDGKGITSAYEYIDGMGISEAEKSLYRTFAVTAHSDNETQYGLTMSKIVEDAQKVGYDNYQIADMIEKAGVPRAYRKPAAEALRFQGDMEEYKQIVETQGSEAGLEWIRAPEREYTQAQTDLAESYAEGARADALANVTNRWAEKGNQLAEKGLTLAPLKEELKRSAEPDEWKEAAMDKLEAIQTDMVDKDFFTVFEQNRYDIDDLIKQRDIVQKDPTGAYAGIPELQEAHLNRLDMQISNMTPKEGQQANNPEALAALKTLKEGMQSGKYSVNQVVNMLTDPNNPNYDLLNSGLNYGTWKTFFNETLNFIGEESVSAQAQYIRDVDKNLDAFLNETQGTEWTDKNFIDIAASIKGELYNAVKQNPNIPMDSLREIFNESLAANMGDQYDLLTQTYQKTGEVSLPQLYEKQQMIDAGEIVLRLDEFGRPSYPRGWGDAIRGVADFGRTLVSDYLDEEFDQITMYGRMYAKPTEELLQGFKTMPGGKVSAQTIYVYGDRKFTVKAATDKNDFVLYEVKDGQEIEVKRVPAVERVMEPMIIPGAAEDYLKSYGVIPKEEKKEEEKTPQEKAAEAMRRGWNY